MPESRISADCQNVVLSISVTRRQRHSDRAQPSKAELATVQAVSYRPQELTLISRSRMSGWRSWFHVA